jgi:hypothetical protein
MSNLIDNLVELMQRGDVLLADTVSAGPYKTACGEPEYAVIGNGRFAHMLLRRKSPRHVAQIFVRCIGESNARKALQSALERNS